MRGGASAGASFRASWRCVLPGIGGTIVTVSLDYEVAGPLEWLVDALFGAVDFHLVKSLLHFRSHLEREASRSGIVTGGQRAMPAP